MIVYDVFWETIKRKNISTYALINKYNISPPTIDRLRHNKPLRTTTLDDLCTILDCKLQDIAIYKPNKNR